MQTPLLGELSATPWSFSPLWLVVLALLAPALLWLALAWRKALLECPNRLRRSGVKDLRRLMQRLQRSNSAPEPAHLRACLHASARVWNVSTAAPGVIEISQAAQSLSGDVQISARWRELWTLTEHGLYCPEAQPLPEWQERATTAASSVDLPKRERWLPNRLSHWLPALSVALLMAASFQPSMSHADVPWSSPVAEETPASEEPAATTESLTPETAQAAQSALDAHWNDWAAHRTLAEFQTQQGQLNLAVAHATAAFVQHPSSMSTRDTLLTAFGYTPDIDPAIQRLAAGAWYERAPTLLSVAGWQWLASIATALIVLGLGVMIASMYLRSTHPALLWTGRGGVAVGALVLSVALLSWNAYGPLNQPGAAMLVETTNLSPVPTDLVPMEETSPLAAGTVVVTGRRFLGWREVSRGSQDSGWIRNGALLPLYASR